MKNLSEFTATTPVSELYRFLANVVVQNGITDFSGLLTYTKSIAADKRTAEVYPELFALIRKLYWGFFRDIDPKVYPKVWREIVISHPQFPECGDLKRNLTISEIYVGILDLHGYTRFCEKNKNNLSMLQTLDDLIQVEMTKLARSHDVVLQRRQGDEMVLVGAGATDLLATTLKIIDFFAKKGGGASARASTLPDIHISAGIAGGKKFTPFIITRDGDLSGGVVNTAARLQSRANELSGERSRIVVSRAVQTAFQAENKDGLPENLGKRPLHFFDSGYIRFKGIEVAVCEVLYDDGDRYKAQIEKDMAELYKSIEAGAWKEGLFGALLTLLIRIYKNMGAFSIQVVSNGLPTTLSNDSIIHISQEILGTFKVKQDYPAAVRGLAQLVDYSREIPGFDKLTQEYAERVVERYRTVADEFDLRIAGRLKEKAATLPAKYKQLYEESRKGALVQERLNLELRKNLTPLEISQLWAAAIDAKKEWLDLTIYSGKR